MKLSDHFTVEELCKSQTALRFGINNTPIPSHIDNLKYLAITILEPIRKEFGPFTPSSGYRSRGLNKKIGGSSKSQHSKGEAADIEIIGVSNKLLAAWIFHNLKYDQLILEFWSEDNTDPNQGWVHVSASQSVCRNSCLTFNGKIYSPLLL